MNKIIIKLSIDKLTETFLTENDCTIDEFTGAVNRYLKNSSLLEHETDKCNHVWKDLEFYQYHFCPKCQALSPF